MIFPLHPNPGLKRCIGAGLESIPGGRTGSPAPAGSGPLPARQGQRGEGESRRRTGGGGSTPGANTPRGSAGGLGGVNPRPVPFPLLWQRVPGPSEEPPRRSRGEERGGGSLGGTGRLYGRSPPPVKTYPEPSSLRRGEVSRPPVCLKEGGKGRGGPRE